MELIEPVLSFISGIFSYLMEFDGNPDGVPEW
jgi:hypothetical protein